MRLTAHRIMHAHLLRERDIPCCIRRHLTATGRFPLHGRAGAWWPLRAVVWRIPALPKMREPSP